MQKCCPIIQLFESTDVTLCSPYMFTKSFSFVLLSAEKSTGGSFLLTVMRTQIKSANDYTLPKTY